MALCISFSIAKEAAGDPSRRSTTYYSDAVITSSDPSTCTVAAANPSRGIRNIAKGKSPAFGTDVNAWLFKAACDGGANSFDIELHEDFTEAEATFVAKKYGEIVGRLPKVLRAGIPPSTGIKRLQIAESSYTWHAGPLTGTIYIQTEMLSSRYEDEVMFHEAAHVSLDKRVINTDEWIAARNTDGGFISLYGQSHPGTEDVAESFLAYFQARFVPSRIGLGWEETIIRTMPNRIAYFDALLSANDMIPFTKAKPRKVGLILNDDVMILKPGTASSYDIRLMSPPDAKVTLSPVSSDDTVAKASGPLSFTPRNWHIPQTVTVTSAASGNVSISHTLTSSDSNYTIAASNLPGVDVGVTSHGPIQLTVSASREDVVRGGTKTITLALNRPLVAGEEIKVPLHIPSGDGFARHAPLGNGWGDWTDYLLACENPLPTGVTCPDLSTSLADQTVTFTFTGPSATSLNLTLSAHARSSSNNEVEQVHLEFRNPSSGVTLIDHVSVFNIRGVGALNAAVLSVGGGNPSDERSDRVFVTEGAKATATVSLSTALSSSSCFVVSPRVDFSFHSSSKEVEDYTFGNPLIRYHHNSAEIFSYDAKICIPAGKTEGSTVIEIVDDTDVEDEERIGLHLNSRYSLNDGPLLYISRYSADDGTLLDIDSTTVDVMIKDNDHDATRPEVSIAGKAASATEGGDAVFTVTASPAPAANLTVSLAVTDDGSSDFLDLGDEGKKTVTIAANQTSAELTIPTQDDSVDEADGSIAAIVQAGNGYTPSDTNGSASVAISDNDDPPPIEVSIAAKVAATTEGDDAVFTISADAAPTVDIEVTLSVTDDTSSDFLDSTDEGNQTVTITANQTSAELTVSTQDDSVIEAEGSVTATVQTGSGYTVANTNDSASVAISDNDGPTLSVMISPASASEGNAGNTYATVTFDLDPVRGESTSFKACLNNTGTATRGASADYQFVNGGNDTPLTLTNDCHSYTLAANAASGSARLLVRGDGNFEPDETVVVELKDPPAGVVVSQTAGTATHVIVNDDAAPTACVSETLIQTVEGYYDHNKNSAPGYGYNWFRVLVAFGERSASEWTTDNRVITPMTGAEANEREQNWFGWTPIADALECLEGGTIDPEITISGANAISEGGSATFTLTASRAPQSTITVNVNVVDSGNFADSGQAGPRQITIGTGGSGTLTVSTDNDSADEPDGTLTAIVASGTGYTLGTASSSVLDVADNDATTVTLAGTADKVTEGGTKAVTLTLGRGLVQGETLAVPITFAGTATRNTDYTLSGTDATGVTYTNLNSGTASVKFTGPNSGTTATVAAITFNATADSTAESPEETVDIGLGTLVQTGLSGGTTETDSLASFNITDPAPLPVITVTGGATVTEGTAAGFIVSATPNPSATLTVNLNVTQSGQFAALADLNTQTMTVDTSGTATYTVDTVGDQVNEADGSVTVTVGSGTGYTVGSPSAATVAVSDDDIPPSTCVPETLLQKVEEYYDHNKDSSPGYGHNWFRVLVAFGERSPSAWTQDSRAITSMTAVEAQQREASWFGWGPVAEALECLEGTSNDPEITISGTNTITEGGSATFTLTATPTPSSSITVTRPALTFSSGYSGSVAGSSITLSAGQSTVNFDVNVDNDSVDRPDGTLTVALQTGTGYTLGTTTSFALDVADNDTTTVTLAGTADKVSEGSTKALTLTLGRGLVQGETLTVPITFAGTATRNTDYTLSGTGATGVTYTNLNSGTASIKFTGPNSGTTATIATVTFSVATDATTESPEETVDIGLGTPTNSGLGGGVSVTDSLASFNIADPAPLPVITITAGSGVTEGTAASFAVSATPHPSATLTVNLNITQTGQFAANTDLGTQTVTVGTSGTATYAVDTVGDQVNEADGSVTVTVGSGTGYTVGNPSSATVAVSDDDIASSTCVPETLLQKVEEYYDHNKDSSPGYGHNWFRVLVAFGERSPSAWTQDSRAVTSMTAAEAQQREQNWFGWGPVAEALECLEGAIPVPEITIAGGSTITEGGSATFTLTATPAPSGSITVTAPTLTFSSGYSGSVSGLGISLPAGQSTVDFDVDVDSDSVDRPDGTLNVALQSGTGYTLGTASSLTLDVTDNDATTVTLAGTADKVTEGGTKTLTVTLGRGLVQGETLTVPLTFGGTATRNADYTLSDTAATGVTYTNLNSGTASVKFTGPNSGATAAVASLTFSAAADSTAESPEETVDIGLGTPTNSGLGGGVSVTDSLADFNIADPALLPAITVTAGPAVTEGTSASFTVNAVPHPDASLTVNLNVTQSGQFVASADRGAQTVVVGTSGTATYAVDTVGDQVNEADGSVTVTVDSATGYTVGNPSAATVAVSDDDIAPSNCVPDALLQKVEEYYDHNKDSSPGYGHNWFRVLVAFGGRSPSAWTQDSRAVTSMTAAEAQQREANWFGWGPVAEALECLEGVAPSEPEITVAGGTGVTEGGDAVFTVSANPVPTVNLTVTLTVADDATSDFLVQGDEGAQIVDIAAGQASATLTLATVQDSDDEADGVVTASVAVGTGYRLGSPSTATVAVEDDDVVPVVDIAGGTGVAEGSDAVFTLTATPAPLSNITVKVDVADSGDFASSGEEGSRQVTIGTTGTATLDVKTDNDAAYESDGKIIATVESGSGYKPSSTKGSAFVAITDDDAPPSTPVVSVTAGADVDEGNAAGFTVKAIPAPTVDLNIAYTVVQSGDVLDAPGTGTRAVTLAAGTASADFTVATVDDGTVELSGSVSVTLASGTNYTLAVGQGSATVNVRDNDKPVVSIAAGAGVTEGAGGSFTVTANPAPEASLEVTLTVGQSGEFAASGETGQRTVTVPVSGTVDVEVATVDDDADEPDGSVAVTVNAGTGYAVAAPPGNSAEVQVSDNDPAPSGPTVSVADATFKENQGRGFFTITLSEPAERTVTVYYATRDSSPVSATAGRDYFDSKRAWRKSAWIFPGKTTGRIPIYIYNDSHDEDPETFELVLYEVDSGVSIADGVAVGTIVNSDPMPAAWLSRFGRTAAQQAIDGVAGRIADARSAGTQGTVAGHAVSFGAKAFEPDAAFEASAKPGYAGGLGDSGFGTESDDFGVSGARTYSLSAREALLGSSFTATGEADGAGGTLAFWGRASQSDFDGKEGAFSLDGESTASMAGVDYARDGWLAGMALMLTDAKGGYRDAGASPRAASQICQAGTASQVIEGLCRGALREGGGKVEASLTAAVPYASLQMSDRLKVWGALGRGKGEITLRPATGGELETDIAWTMAAAGLRGAVLSPDQGSGLSLAVISDALWARTESDSADSLASSDSSVTRIRFGLEGSWRTALEHGGHVTPRFEIGARHDGGDAETGFGVELGAGLSWSDPGMGLSMEISGRTLAVHGDDDFKERGLAASVSWDPDPSTRRGPSLTLARERGGRAEGGLDALFEPATPDSLAAGIDDAVRWHADAAYGFAIPGRRFTASPYAGVGLFAGGRQYTLGWRVTPAKGAPNVSFAMMATRSESTAAAPDHAIGFEVTAHW